MRITHLAEAAFPVRSTLRNAVFSFAEMTTSIVAVQVDPGRGKAPVTGYAFNSTGRYACGQPMRDRFFPRLLRAAPESLLDADGMLDPARARSAMLVGEKPGGHAERSVAPRTAGPARRWRAKPTPRGRRAKAGKPCPGRGARRSAVFPRLTPAAAPVACSRRRCGDGAPLQQLY